MKIRPATVADIPGLLEPVRRFIAEADYGWSYDPMATIERLKLHLALPSHEILVEDGLKGGAIICWDRDFTKERVGYIVKFYVMPEKRGMFVGLALAEACDEWFRAHGCVAAFCTSTGRVGQEEAFNKLFARQGFTDCGPTLMKEYR